MLVYIWTRDDGIGLPEDFRDGDPMTFQPDSWETHLGDQEKKSWLVVKIPDPVGYGANADPPDAPAFPAKPDSSAVDKYFDPTFSVDGTGATIINKARAYTVFWTAKFSAADRATIRDATQMLGDGIIRDLFTIDDFIPKN